MRLRHVAVALFALAATAVLLSLAAGLQATMSAVAAAAERPTPPPTMLMLPPTTSESDAVAVAASFLQTRCCAHPPCNIGSLFDLWCFDRNTSCPVFPGGGHSAKACHPPLYPRKTRTAHVSAPPYGPKCAPRWRSLGTDSADDDATLPIADVAGCMRSFVTVLASVGAFRAKELQRMQQDYTEGWSGGRGVAYGADDFPIGLARTSHMCQRPCNSVWRCTGSGKSRNKFAYDPCYKHFYGNGKHFRLRSYKSTMAVWMPPVPDQISLLLQRSHGYDPKLHAAIRLSLNRPRGVVLDVGSNLGVVSLFATHMGHRAVAFDPTPWTRHKLHLSLYLNGLTDRVKVIPAAAGDAPGQAWLAMVPGNLGGNQLKEKEKEGGSGSGDGGGSGGGGRPDKKGTVLVKVVTVDDEVERLNLTEPVIFIKIDVEGHEIAAVRGARRTIARYHPAMIIETCFWCRPAVLFALMRGMGYVCGKDDSLVERTKVAEQGKWPWDVIPVLQPLTRSQLRPNVVCVYDPEAASRPFDAELDPGYTKKWQAYTVDA